MAPVLIIKLPCETMPCNMSDATVYLANMTMPPEPDDTTEVYDHAGAAKFIVATILVYSLIGVLGTLLLRIKRSASRSRRSMTVREESIHTYIKETDRLMMEGRRDLMKKETERYTKRLDRQMSQESNRSSTSDNSLTPTMSDPHQVSRSPSLTSPNVLTSLLPTVPEWSDAMSDNVPKFVFHFPPSNFNPAVLNYETRLVPAITTAATSSVTNSTPVILMTAIDIDSFPGLPSGNNNNNYDGSSAAYSANSSFMKASAAGSEATTCNVVTEKEKTIDKTGASNNNEDYI